MLDVDFFKLYNDTYGHQAGDDCLAKLAEVMKQSVKRPGDIVCRYGGEEFIIMMVGTELVGAIHVAQRIKANIIDIRIPFEISEVSDVLTVSAGVSTFVPSEEYTTPILILAADTALYQAKVAGRNKIFVFNTDSALNG